jgi:ABC-type microcin C transport system duplicated ATPase subunit YejF|tara:strand:+ start:1250 stop:1414 length:165 start_codon:yes stop_codon:yes gene_type:complete
MAKISIVIPEPKEEYDTSNQRQIIEAIDTLKNQLNFSFQFDLKEEQDSFNWFIA